MKWALTLLQVVGWVIVTRWVGQRIGRVLFRVSRAIDRFGCLLVGHARPVGTLVPRPDGGLLAFEVQFVCRDCRSPMHSTFDVGRFQFDVERVTIQPLTDPYNAAVERMRQEMGLFPNPLSLPMIRVGRGPIHYGSLVASGGMPSFRATEDRWSDEDSHENTRQVVEFDEPDEGLCWRCVFAPETTAVGLCAPCFDAVRAGASVDG